MIASARAAGRHLLNALVVRYFPDYRSLAGALRDGEIGSAVSLTMVRQAHYASGSGGWFWDVSKSGGVFVDLMVHDFDWALQTLGPALRVHARLVERSAPRRFAQGVATIRHRSGAISQITGIWGHPGPLVTVVEISGDGGLLRYHSAESPAFRVSVPALANASSDMSIPDVESGENPYGSELAHFVDVVLGRAAPIVLPEESLAALSLALASRDSAATGRPVLLKGGAE
jgi:predicted dehydrogenase